MEIVAGALCPPMRLREVISIVSGPWLHHYAKPTPIEPPPRKLPDHSREILCTCPILRRGRADVYIDQVTPENCIQE
jgi:hypothetical protein